MFHKELCCVMLKMLKPIYVWRRKKMIFFFFFFVVVVVVVVVFFLVNAEFYRVV